MLSFLGITVIVVLGCHINTIQQDRVNIALDFLNQAEFISTNTSKIEPFWFLSGGVKHALEKTSEAVQMSNSISFVTQNIVLDTTAKNTAENFLNLKKWIKSSNDLTNVNIVISTSKFHQNRAKKIFDGIFHDTKMNPHWLLGRETCKHCESDELIHIKNVNNDVKNALKLQV
jgi:hypothetical protein